VYIKTDILLSITPQALILVGGAESSVLVKAESLKIKRRYSCRAMLNFEPVAHPACTCVRMVEMNCQY